MLVFDLKTVIILYLFLKLNRHRIHITWCHPLAILYNKIIQINHLDNGHGSTKSNKKYFSTLIKSFRYTVLEWCQLESKEECAVLTVCQGLIGSRDPTRQTLVISTRIHRFHFNLPSFQFHWNSKYSDHRSLLFSLSWLGDFQYRCNWTSR